MKAITLRNIPPKVQKGIRERTRQKRISANRAVIELLQERLEHYRQHPDDVIAWEEVKSRILASR